MLRLSPVRHCMGTARRVRSQYLFSGSLPSRLFLTGYVPGWQVTAPFPAAFLSFPVSCWFPSIRSKNRNSCVLVSGLFFVFVFVFCFLLCIIPMLSLQSTHIFVNNPFYKPFQNYPQFECAIPVDALIGMVFALRRHLGQGVFRVLLVS